MWNMISEWLLRRIAPTGILPATDPQMEVLSWNVDVHAASGKIHSLIVFMTNVSWFLRPDFPPDSSPQSASSLPLDRSLVAVCCIMLQKRLRLQCFQILLPRKTPAIFLKHIEIHLAVWMSFMGAAGMLGVHWGSTAFYLHKFPRPTIASLIAFLLRLHLREFGLGPQDPHRVITQILAGNRLRHVRGTSGWPWARVAGVKESLLLLWNCHDHFCKSGARRLPQSLRLHQTESGRGPQLSTTTNVVAISM